MMIRGITAIGILSTWLFHGLIDTASTLQLIDEYGLTIEKNPIMAFAIEHGIFIESKLIGMIIISAAMIHVYRSGSRRWAAAGAIWCGVSGIFLSINNLYVLIVL